MAKKRKDKTEDSHVLSEEEIAELCNSNEYMEDIPLDVVSKKLHVEKKGSKFLIKNKMIEGFEEEGLSIAG